MFVSRSERKPVQLSSVALAGLMFFLALVASKSLVALFLFNEHQLTEPVRSNPKRAWRSGQVLFKTEAEAWEAATVMGAVTRAQQVNLGNHDDYGFKGITPKNMVGEHKSHCE